MVQEKCLFESFIIGKIRTKNEIIFLQTIILVGMLLLVIVPVAVLVVDSRIRDH